MQKSTTTDADIRDYLDHDRNTRRVRVKRTGEVMIKGGRHRRRRDAPQGLALLGLARASHPRH